MNENIELQWKCFTVFHDVKAHNVLQRRMILHCDSHDTLKSGSNIQTLLDCYVFTLLTRLVGILTFEI